MLIEKGVKSDESQSKTRFWLISSKIQNKKESKRKMNGLRADYLYYIKRWRSYRPYTNADALFGFDLERENSQSFPIFFITAFSL